MQKMGRQAWLNVYRVSTIVLLTAILVMGAILVARPTGSSAPSASEIAAAVNGPAEFTRPSQMEYVAKTNSYVCGGEVTYTQWYVAGSLEPVYDSRKDRAIDERYTNSDLPDNVSYTVFGFRTDTGRTFEVSSNGQLFTDPGENLGLELTGASVDAPKFHLERIVWGGK